MSCDGWGAFIFFYEGTIKNIHLRNPECVQYIKHIIYSTFKMALIVYASEIAACVGMNKYKSVEDAKMDVWQRWDSSSFHRAFAGKPSVQKSPEEVFSSLAPSVQKLVSNAVSSGTEKGATQVVQAALKEKANTVTPETQLVKAIVLSASKKESVDDACKTLVGSRQIVESLNNSLTENCSAADVKRVIDSVLVKDVKEARESVVHTVNCKRGIQNEHKGIASYEKSKRVKLHGKNSNFYKKCIGQSTFGTPVYVGGKVDGLTDDKVVEIKCRRNHLFNTLPLYEKVQTQAYLFLTGKDTVEVLQKYDGYTRSDEYMADAEFWGKVCHKALSFASDLESMISINSALI